MHQPLAFLTAAALVALGSMGATSGYAQTATLLDPGFLNGGDELDARAVSDDGTIVVGGSNDSNGDSFAFRWTQAGGLQSLGGLNGGTSSIALGISGDGSVIVGNASDAAAGGFQRAFRWTQATGLVSLGTLNGGLTSAADDTNADGSVVVGFAGDGTFMNAARAYRWTQATGMVSLDTLNGGTTSYATAVSADGSVVVGGSADGAAADAQRAFRWTQATGMVSLGDLNGGDYSLAYDVSADGTVVVGTAQDGAVGGANRAFRWTQASGLQSLGVLSGGTFSEAVAVSANGQVIVGRAGDGANGNVQRAMRWTQATGMQTVEDWLRANGATIVTDTTQNAFGVSADGSVVVGSADNNSAFIARVSAQNGAGIIDTAEYAKSLESTGAAVISVGSQADLHLNGTRSTPLLGLVNEGQGMLWTVGDISSRDREGGNGYQALAELGYNYGLKKNLQVGLGLGLIDGQQDLVFDGSLRQDGFYFAPEVLWNPQGKLYISALGYYNDGDINLRRGYDNGGTPNFSNGRTDMKTMALRLRADWKDAFGKGQTKLTPNVSYTYIRTELDGFTETDGGFPVAWEDYTDASNTLRVALDANHALNKDTTILGRVEAAHRFEERSDGARGQVIGLSNFETSGSSRKQTWFRGGLGAETNLGQGKASVMLNVSTEGENKPDAWLSVGYRIRF